MRQQQLKEDVFAIAKSKVWTRSGSETEPDMFPWLHQVLCHPMQLLWEADAVETGVLKGNAEYKKHIQVKILTAGII